MHVHGRSCYCLFWQNGHLLYYVESTVVYTCYHSSLMWMFHYSNHTTYVSCTVSYWRLSQKKTNQKCMGQTLQLCQINLTYGLTISSYESCNKLCYSNCTREVPLYGSFCWYLHYFLLSIRDNSKIWRLSLGSIVFFVVYWDLSSCTYSIYFQPEYYCWN